MPPVLYLLFVAVFVLLVGTFSLRGKERPPITHWKAALLTGSVLFVTGGMVAWAIFAK